MATTKEKRSVTLSVEALAVVDQVQKESGAASVSAALEKILLDLRHERERQRIIAEASIFYDQISDEQARESEEWGRFALTQFPTENRKRSR